MTKREPILAGSTSRPRRAGSLKGTAVAAARQQADVDLSTYRGRLGASIRARREQQRLSVAELVDALMTEGVNVTATTLYHYEKGRRPIQVDDLPGFARALKTTVHKLLPKA